MRLKFICIFCLFFSFLSSPVLAAKFTGSYLLEMCASDKNGKELVKGGHIACQSYIAGIVDYHNLMHSLGTAPSIDFCVPEGVTLDRLQNIVGAYLYKNKNIHGSFVASPGVALALFSAYPCKKK
jgi:hypothetical protein